MKNYGDIVSNREEIVSIQQKIESSGQVRMLEVNRLVDLVGEDIVEKFKMIAS